MKRMESVKRLVVLQLTSVSLIVQIIAYAYIWYKFRQAKEAFLKDDMLMSHENLVLIIYYFTPLNIVLSFINIYLGVTFRGFL